ncbi:hypothetical protein Tco_0072977 [Tanacetum coccineum]
MGRGSIQLEDAISTIFGEYLLEFTSEYGIPEDLHPELPGPEETIVDFLKGKVDVYTKRGQKMDLFNLISAPNPAKVKTGTRPRAAHEVPLLTATATRVIDMEEVTEASESSGIPSLVEKSPLDFADEDPLPVISEGVGTGGQARDEVPHEIPPAGNPPTTEVAPDLEPEAAAMGSLVRKRRRERGSDGANANAPPKVLRKDHASIRSEQSTHGGKSLTSMGLAAGSIFVTPTDAKSVSDPDPLSYAEPRPFPEQEIAQSSEIPTGNVATAEVQNLRDQRIQAREDEIKRLDQEIQSIRTVEEEVHGLRNRTKNLETLMEAEVDMKRVAEAKNAELTEELESLRAQFFDLQVNNNQLSQQVSNLQAHVTDDEKIKAAFEDFKKYKDDKVEQRCAEMDA